MTTWYYIYTMSVKDIVFYVGMTNRPTDRYREHFHDCLSKCYPITRYCVADRGEICKMNIIDVADHRFDARRLEHQHILELSKTYYLINHEKWNNSIKNKIPYTPRLETYLRLSEEYKHIKQQINSLKCQRLT